MILDTPRVSSSGPAESAMPRSYLAGLILSNNVGSPTTNIDIGVGACRSEQNDEDLILAVALNKNLHTSWTEGSGGAFLGEAPIWSEETLHIYLIKDPVNDVVDVACQLDYPPSTAFPEGFTSWRRIGSIYHEGGSLIQFKQTGDSFILKNQYQNYLGGGSPGSPDLQGLVSIPYGVKMEAILNVALFSGGTLEDSLILWDPDINTVAPGVIGVTYVSGASSAMSGSQARVITNTNRQIYRQTTAAETTIGIHTIGWIDRRGRDD